MTVGHPQVLFSFVFVSGNFEGRGQKQTQSLGQRIFPPSGRSFHQEWKRARVKDTTGVQNKETCQQPPIPGYVLLFGETWIGLEIEENNHLFGVPKERYSQGLTLGLVIVAKACLLLNGWLAFCFPPRILHP